MTLFLPFHISKIENIMHLQKLFRAADEACDSIFQVWFEKLRHLFIQCTQNNSHVSSSLKISKAFILV